jgi:hypothetical protein
LVGYPSLIIKCSKVLPGNWLEFHVGHFQAGPCPVGIGNGNFLLVAGKYFEILLSLEYFLNFMLGCLKNFWSKLYTNFSLMMEFLHSLASSGCSC